MLVGGPGTSPALPATCRRCAELEEQVIYWRTREERTADALLHAKGVQGRVASPPAPKTTDGMAILAKGMGITEIDSTKSQQPGQAAMTGGDARH